MCATLLVVLSAPLAGQPSRESLLKDIRIDKSPLPRFSSLSVAQLTEKLNVSIASLDEEPPLPAIEVPMPDNDNLAYAVVQFGEPLLTDAKNRVVKTEHQSGSADSGTPRFLQRLFLPGGEQPASFTSATLK